MSIRMLVLVFALAVSTGFALCGCRRGGRDVDTLCNKMSNIRAAAEKNTSKNAAAAGAKECEEKFSKLSDSQKKKAAQAADDAIKSCGDRQGEEYKKCIDYYMAKLKNN